MDATGKVAIVTGSATGVGAEVARQLAGLGASVVINYTKSRQEAEETKAACEALGAKTLLVQADVSNNDDCQRMVAETMAAFGRVDFLVNNAGTSKFAAHHDLDALEGEDFHRIYDVNVVGPYQMIRAAQPAMKQSGGGTVVNVSSIAGVKAIGSSVAYCASKAALNNMTVSLARALGPDLRINAVCPGLIQTRWLKEGLGEEFYNALVDGMKASNPLKDASTPAEIAEPIVWLLLGAKHVTGETMLVDAGQHLV